MDYQALVDELPDEVVDLIAEQQEEIEKLQKRLDGEVSDTPDTPDSEEETSFAKSFPEEYARLQAAEAALAAERTARADAEWVAKADSYRPLAVDPAELGPALRQVAETLPEAAALVEKALQAATAQVATADIFKELGHGVPTPGSAEEQIEQIAKARLAEDPSLESIEAARADVYIENPDLYARYQAERQR